MKCFLTILLVFCSITIGKAAPLLPIPREMTQGSARVAVSGPYSVLGATENPRANAALRAALNALGVKGSRELSESAPIPAKGTLILLGKSAAARLLPDESAALQKLPEDGYLLRVDQKNGRTQIVLAGGAEIGTFYAIQTLRQLLESGPTLKQTRITDAPVVPRRGVVEGFYGPPWSHEDRLSLFRFMGDCKMNVYIYAPKDDPFHRDRWRDDYPPAEKQRIRELARVASDNFVDFTYAIAPGLSATYSSEADLQALCDKIDAVKRLGIRHFSLLFDDIPWQMRNAEDKKRFSNLGEAHSYFANKLYDHMIAADPRATLVLCPTSYAISKPNTYLKTMGKILNPKIEVMWTGVNVMPFEITAEQADTIAAGTMHKPYVWDNYPCNDGNRKVLYMTAIRNRSAELATHIAGLVSNPMMELEASKVPLLTYADYLWNPKAYVPDQSWEVAVERVSGPKAHAAFRLFCEQCLKSDVYTQDPPTITKLVDAYKAKPTEATRKPMRDLLKRFVQVREELPKTLENKKLVREIGDYTDKLARDGEVGLAYLDLMTPQAKPELSVTWRRWLTFREARARMQERAFWQMCGSAIDRLISDAPESIESSLGIPWRRASSQVGRTGENRSERILDRDPATFLWGDRAPRAGDWVLVEMDSARPVDRIQVLMGHPDHPDDWVRQGELQYTTDMKEWKKLADVNSPEVLWEGSPTPMRAARIEIKQRQDYWVLVREFNLHAADEPNAMTSLTPAAGSLLDSVGDGNPQSVFRSTGPVEKGDYVQLDLGEPAPRIQGVALLMEPKAFIARAKIERSMDGKTWTQIAQSSDCAVQAKFAPVTARYIRVIAAAGQPSPIAIHDFQAIRSLP